MKTNRLILYALGATFMLFSCGDGSKGSKKQKITISGAFALYPLTVKWAEIYMKENPTVQIDISAGGAGKGMTDVLSNMVDIAMLSRGIEPIEIQKGAFGIAVAKDAVVPVFNSENPLKQLILERGADSAKLAEIYVDGKISKWNELVGETKQEVELHLFTRSDACGAGAMWALFLGKNQEDLKGTGVFGDPGIADAVMNDILGLGYNNIVYVYDLKTRKKNAGIEVLPLDVNKNGIIDPDENVYETVDQITKAIKEGKYPSPPARDLYLITNGKPENKDVAAFITWILKQGQQYVEEAGYVNFSSEKIAKELEKLN